MKTATVRDVQHGLKAILANVATGETVCVTRRKRVVAHIVPPPAGRQVEFPDFMARLKREFPQGVKGKPVSEIVDEGRGPRP